MSLNLRFLYLSALVCFCVRLALPQAGSTGDITEAELKAVINESADCESLDEINFDPIQYADLLGNGSKQAIVVAATCMTGTAGPDIHAVYARDAAGNVVELPFHHAEGDPFFNNDGPQLPVFGNRNYTFEIADGKLVAKWGDDSDRENPLTIWYKWDGKAFVVDHTRVEGPFPTSYDCGKATKEIDRAICYSPKISALDMQLAKVYRAALQRPADQKKNLQNQQRQWLAERDKQCTIYKWWVDCLSDLYEKRIAELKSGTSGVP
jgi:uncharacterized protein YecT (DUF1311 family)